MLRQELLYPVISRISCAAPGLPYLLQQPNCHLNLPEAVRCGFRPGLKGHGPRARGNSHFGAKRARAKGTAVRNQLKRAQARGMTLQNQPKRARAKGTTSQNQPERVRAKGTTFEKTGCPFSPGFSNMNASKSLTGFFPTTVSATSPFKV